MSDSAGRFSCAIKARSASGLLQAVEAALLPRHLPQIPGMELAVAFTSATEMAQVGGDFYDTLALESGEVLVYVGDVCGKGIEAAGVAARVRHGVSDLARTCHGPSELLAQADELLADILPADRFVTLVFAVTAGKASSSQPSPAILARCGLSAEGNADGDRSFRPTSRWDSSASRLFASGSGRLSAG